MQLPSLALIILRRSYKSYWVSWSQIVSDGERYVGAARFLVAKGLVTVVDGPKGLFITEAGLNELRARGES